MGLLAPPRPLPAAARAEATARRAQENVNRLKAYKASLVVFPRRAKKPKAGDSSKEELAAVQQAKGALLPIAHAAPAAELETVKITEEMQARPAAAAALSLQRAGAGSRARPPPPGC